MHGHYGNPPRFASCPILSSLCSWNTSNPPAHLCRCHNSWFSSFVAFPPGALLLYFLIFQRGQSHVHIDAYICIVSWLYLAYRNVITQLYLYFFLFLLFGVIYLSPATWCSVLSASCLILCSKIFFLYLSLIMFLMIKINKRKNDKIKVQTQSVSHLSPRVNQNAAASNDYGAFQGFQGN